MVKKQTGYLMRISALCALILPVWTSIVFGEDNAFVYHPHGRRDPFVLWGQMPSRSDEVGLQVEVDLEEVILEGIVWDGEEPLAIINGSILSAGGQVGDFVLHEISANKIVLRKDDEFHIIELTKEED